MSQTLIIGNNIKHISCVVDFDDGEFSIIFPCTIDESFLKGEYEKTTLLTLYDRLYFYTFEQVQTLRDLMRCVGIEYGVGKTFFDGAFLNEHEIDAPYPVLDGRTHILTTVQRAERNR